MRLRNTTSFSDELILEAINFVKLKGIGHFRVRVTKCSNYFGGVSYPEGNYFHKDNALLPSVTVRITEKEILFPYLQIPWRKNKGYLPSLMLSREEALVHLLAHEIRHLWQKHHRTRRGKVWRSRGVYSERDADAYAIRKQREWRKLKSIENQKKVNVSAFFQLFF